VDTAGEPVQARAQLPKLNTERRITGFEEVHLGLSEAQAYQEALRCLHCSVCSDCRLCAEVCEPKAIDYQMEPEVREIEVGAVILATGLKAYDAQSLGEYGFGRYTNVVTSLQFERLLSASGPTGGHLLRPSDARAPRKVAWIQCVGSRDLRHLSYCSAVCCMYATKEAVVAKEHDAQIEPTIFYMDLRAYGKGFSQLVQRARDQGVRYVRSLISQVIEFPETKNLLIRYRDASGEFKEEEFDLVVLSVGLQPHPKGQDLAQRLGVELDAHGFIKAADSNPVATSQLGIFATGVATGPKDIPEVIIQASAAAAAAGELLAPACGTCIQEKRYPEELAVDGGPRIGVFICHCGSNIAGVVDVKAVAERAATLPGVVHAENVLYACSQDNLKYIKQLIQEKNLNRIVVASCTPRNLEGLFQDTIRESGLNQFLFEMVNIREQCSWVHPDQPEQATDKAKVLVRMSVAKARHLKPLHLQKVPIIANALVIGGGMSGMVAALTLADQGFSTYLVAHGGELGDDLKRVYRTPEGTDVQGLRDELIQRVRAHERIRLFMESEIVEFSGFVGNFRTCLRTPEGETTLEHGAVVVALEGGEHQTEEYLYGRDERILTQRGLERMIHQKPQALQDKKTVVMIQCVGRDAQRPYCSRICCGEAIKNALALANDPERRVYVLYREMMAYGLLEDLYREARERGIVFIRHEEQEPSQVECQNGKILVTVRDARLGQDIRIPADLVALSTGVVPDPMTETLSQTFKVPIDAYGFFSEAHIKLRPVDFASHGLFVCGLSHAPNTILELIAKAQAAAGRAATILSKSHLEAGGVVAIVDREKCTSCLTCLRECPYGAISVDGEGIAVIDPARCQGCGICAADCPAKAIQLQQFEDRQEISMLAELLTAGR
ncbi:MAG: 4Fe-4S binding protein, partial [Anaerolineae bacterium]